MEKEINYYQPFIHLTSLNLYPEIHEIIGNIFPRIKKDIHNNLYTIFCSLLTNPSIAVSRNFNTYKSYNGPSWFTQKKAIKAQNLLVDRGLIKIKKGFRARPGFKKGFSSVIKTTDTLDNLLKGIILRAVKADPESYPVLTVDRKALSLEEIAKFDNSFVDFKFLLNKKVLRSSYLNTSKLNKNYFSKITLGFEPGTIIHISEGVVFEEARAIAKDNQNPVLGMATNVFFTAMYSSKGCGRLYQRCNSFQDLPKKLRKHLTINGAHTKEADYSGMHVNLAYFISDTKNPYLDDVYTPVLKEFGTSNNSNLRDAVKRCILVAFNTPNISSYSKAMYWNYRTYVKQLGEHGISVKDVYNNFLKLNPNIKSIFTSESHKADLLMFYESKIMRGVLNELYKRNIYGLPLHDSLIYNKKYNGIAEKIMKEVYRTITGNDIVVKTS